MKGIKEMSTQQTFSRFTAIVKNIWISFGITLLMIAFLGGLLCAGVYAKIYFYGNADPRVKADAYPDQSWVLAYYKEFSESQIAKWVPWVYHRRLPFNGAFINVDDRGVRRTTTPNTVKQTSNQTIRIFMFGGSTMWGTGARDYMTIPSVLTQMLMDNNIHTQIVNYGESGYVSTQEVIALMLQLQEGNIPDIVIFYDGINDVFSSYLENTAGLSINEKNRNVEFNLTNPYSYNGRWIERFLMNFCFATFIKISTIMDPMCMISPPKPGRSMLSSRSYSLNDSLPRDVASRYVNNLRMVNALAKSYRFKTIFYLQPSLFHKRYLS
jgi:hypothetical protein